MLHSISFSCAMEDVIAETVPLSKSNPDDGKHDNNILLLKRCDANWLASLTLWVVLVTECGLLLVQARNKPLWYDEIFTYQLSSLQPFSVVYEALKAGVDGMPPAYYMVVKLARAFSSNAHLAIRLPSIAGYVLTMVGVYMFARKRLPAVAGVMAVLLVVLSPFRAYATEARSYALVTGLLAIAAAAWQRIGDRRLFTPLYGMLLAMAVSCHYLAAAALVPFGIAELGRTLKTRQIRWGVWAANVIAIVPFVIGLPILIHYTATFGRHFWSKPSWGSAISTYSFYVGIQSIFWVTVIVFLGLLMATAVIRASRETSSSDEGRPRSHELILLTGLMFYPSLLVMVAKIMESGYTQRYAWPAILGFSLGAVYLLQVYRLPFVQFAIALVITFGVQSSSGMMRAIKAEAGAGKDRRWTSLQQVSNGRAAMPVVIGSGIAYIEAFQYAPGDLQKRLVGIVDVDTAARLVGTDSVDGTIARLAQYLPVHVEHLKAFKEAYGNFLLFSGGPFDWFTGYLLQEGYQMQLVRQEASDGYSIYLVQK